jgi:hypothetical protein
LRPARLRRVKALVRTTLACSIIDHNQIREGHGVTVPQGSPDLAASAAGVCFSVEIDPQKLLGLGTSKSQPQRLKPDHSATACGTTRVVPFPNSRFPELLLPQICGPKSAVSPKSCLSRIPAVQIWSEARVVPQTLKSFRFHDEQARLELDSFTILTTPLNIFQEACFHARRQA